ncbi:MAG: putative baseplate assembly protein [Kofleriaceae bacterium]
MAFRDQTALVDRARAMATTSLNGMRQVRVTLEPDQAVLELAFWNDHELAAILADPTPPARLFPITGGGRLRGGPGQGLVQVTSIAQGPDPEVLVLTVAPIGDYSTYTLSIDHANIDPLFSSLAFKFRPGCFSIDCAPDWTQSPKPEPAPPFDSLARDYESFRHALVVAMQNRVPGWRPTSDADLSVTLLDLLAASADELADVQDRVMNEAYLATARKRVSLARHARLVDYYIHEGNQASTLLALRATQDAVLPAGFAVTTHADATLGTTFVSVEPTPVRAEHGDIRLYTWSDVITALAAGDTAADLAFASLVEADAYVAQVEAQLVPESGLAPPRLVIAQTKDPVTGNAASRDPNRRQLLRLTGATRVSDPQAPAAGIVRVTWRRDDALRNDYCFVERATPEHPRYDDVSLFHGNLARATSGAVFEQREIAPTPTRWGSLVPLRADRPVLYTATPADGATPTRSTVTVTVVTPGDVDHDWTETISLVHSGSTDKHFTIETDEQLRSVLRFGTGTNGRSLPDEATVTATWRTGLGADGNIGRDRLAMIVTAAPPIAGVWNPFDAVDGRAPEPAAEIRRNAPEAYRAHQLRAVTIADYVARAEEIEKVQRAAAQYMWTGSWRTVRVTIDPLGGEVLDPQLVAEVAAHLEPLRLIGEDLEIRPPVYVPLRIVLTVCLRDDVWPEDVRFAILEELSDGYTYDGRLGLFHPDNWTFGQPLHESQIAGRTLRVAGVEHIAKLAITRWDAGSPGDGRVVEVAPNEIISVHNDPDHMERGFVELVLAGGRT